VTDAVTPLDDPLSLREQVERGLRAAVVSGQMRPGVVYSAPALASQFGVSATPVREAMLELVRSGLVESVRNRGFRVTELSDRDLDDITELRALIEVPAVARLAASADPHALEALRPLAEAISAAATNGDLLAYVEADRVFHLSLLALTGNQRIVDTVGDLRSQSRLYGLANLAAESRLAESAAEHNELLDVLLEADTEACVELMRRHIGHVRGIWATGFESSL
jgi:DNA-binding GntR family transcriptional regulator